MGRHYNITLSHLKFSKYRTRLSYNGSCTQLHLDVLLVHEPKVPIRPVFLRIDEGDLDLIVSNLLDGSGLDSGTNLILCEERGDQLVGCHNGQVLP